MFSTDWDLGMAIPNFSAYSHMENGNWNVGYGDDKRIHYNVKIDDAWETRPSKQGGYDPLWVRIESEPMKNPYPGKTPYYNTTRQIVLNFNETNVDEDDPYKFRPYVFFYTGPETRDYAVDENGVRKRHSQPVVINLNEDLNSIFYMPESPVVIHGNGHKLTGFVIAKCYLQSLTSDDMTNNKKIYLWDGFNAMKEFRGNYTELTDGYGNTVYVHANELVNENDIPDPSEDEMKVVDDGTVYIRKKIFEHILLEYTKTDHETYAVTDADGKHNEAKTFAAYINATYKEKFKTFSGLDDSKISAITFPNENYNETTATYYVETAALLSPDDVDIDDSNYVKVIADGTIKYVHKERLPYVKVRTNKDYFYVCVYDLKTAWDGATVNNYASNAGVRMIDNSFDDKAINDSYGTVQAKGIQSGINDPNATASNADIYINPNDKWCDSWGIDRNLLATYKSGWKKNHLELNTDSNFYDKNGIKYFRLKTDSKLKDTPQLMSTYRKINFFDEVRYIKEDSDTEYYMKVSGDDTHPENYIIVDRNGNILTKPVTSPEVLTARKVDANTKLKKKVDAIFSRASDKPLIDYWKTYTRNPKDPAEIPGDRGGTTDDGQYVGLSEYRMNEDYRIPALERVYKAHDAFNLSTDSMYSYFQIPELWRVNYTYLNVDTVNHIANRKDAEESGLWKVDDMFFTKERAAWID